MNNQSSPQRIQEHATSLLKSNLIKLFETPKQKSESINLNRTPASRGGKLDLPPIVVKTPVEDSQENSKKRAPSRRVSQDSMPQPLSRSGSDKSNNNSRQNKQKAKIQGYLMMQNRIKSTAVSRKVSIEEEKSEGSEKRVQDFRQKIAEGTFAAKRPSIVRAPLRKSSFNVPKFVEPESSNLQSFVNKSPVGKTSSIMKDTVSGANKRIKIKKKPDNGLEITMQQLMSILLRKLRYGFTLIKFIQVSVTKSMKSVIYLNLREELKIRDDKVAEFNKKDQENFLGIVPKEKDSIRQNLYDELGIWTTTQQDRFFDDAQILADYYDNKSTSIHGERDSQQNLQSQSKEFILIDGINYSFKHVSFVL